MSAANSGRKPQTVSTIAPVGKMEPPDYLNEAEQKHFRDLAKILETENRASPSHVHIVALAAQRLQEIIDLTKELDGRHTYETVTERSREELHRLHPASKQRSEAMRHLQSLLADLGLTPVAAQRLFKEQREIEEAEKNPFAEFAI